MAEELTATEFLNKGDNLDTLVKYSDDRNLDYETAGDVMKNFLSDYRGLNTNTVKAASFIGYVNQQEDGSDYKNKLGELYKSVDDELESQITGDDVSLGERARGVFEYGKYALVDPINLLGFGAGKAIAMTAGRAAVKGLVNRAFTRGLTETIKRNPVKSAALGAAAPELVAAPTMDYLTQRAEKDLDVRDEIDVGQLLFSTGVGMVTAGAFGATGQKISQGIRSLRGKKSEDVFNALEESSAQGKAGKKESVQDVENKDELTGLYVTLKPENLRKEIDDGGFDEMGRITGVDGDQVFVEFITKERTDTGTLSRETKTFKATEVKALGERTKFKKVGEYLKNAKFFDQDSINRATAMLEDVRAGNTDLGLTPDQMVRISSVLDKTSKDYVDVSTVLAEIYGANKKALDPYIDLRSNKVESIASIGKGLKAAGLDLGTELNKALDAIPANAKGEKITSEQFFDFYRHAASVSGMTLQGAGKADIGSGGLGSAMMRSLSDSEKNLSSADKDLADLYRSVDLQAEKAGNIFSGVVDVWRATLVIQPATTLRNVFGSLAAVPGISLRQKLDQWFINLERNALGLSPESTPKAEDLVKNDLFDLSKRLTDPESSVEILDFMANMNESVRKSFNDNFGDRTLLNTDSPNSNNVINALQNVARKFNVLNISQDRAFKSAAFLSSMQAQINRKINLGVWKKGKAETNVDVKEGTLGTGTFKTVTETSKDGAAKTFELDTIEGIIAQGRFDLLDEAMINNAIKASYDITFQSRNAGDKLFLWRGAQNWVNSAQKFGANNTYAKLVVPFANFMANMFVFTTQRMGGGAIKSVMNIGAWVGPAGKGAREAVAELGKLKRIMDTPKIKGISDDVDAKYIITSKKGKKGLDYKKLREDITKQELIQTEYMRSLTRMKEGFQETAEMAGLVGTALLLRMNYGGDTVNTLKDDEGQSIDAEPLFPLPGMFLIANSILEMVGHEKAVKVNVPQTLSTVLTGYTGREGVLKTGNKLLDQIFKSGKDNTYSSAEDFGKITGALLGQFLGGFVTAPRVLEDLYDSTYGAGEKKSYESRRKTLDLFDTTDSEFLKGLSATVNEIASRATRGTRAEDWLYEGTPERRSVTEGTIEKSAAVPALKQATGARTLPATSPLQSEIDREGVEGWKLKKYSEVPAYDTKFNQIMGEAASRVAPYLLSSEEYKNAPRFSSSATAGENTKAEMLENLYSGSAPIGDATFRKGTKYDSNLPPSKNLKEYARNYMKLNHPGLSALTSYKTAITKNAEAKVEKFFRSIDPAMAEGVLSRIKEYSKKDYSVDSAEESQLRMDVGRLEAIRDQLVKKDSNFARNAFINVDKLY